MNSTNEVLYEIKYKISLDDYKEFYNQIAIKSLNKPKRKAMFFGSIQIVLALSYIFTYFFIKQNTNFGILLLAFGILLVGIFTVLYYPVFFKKGIMKTINKVYNKLDYFKEEITLEIYDDCCCEKVLGETNYKSYDLFIDVDKSDNLIALMFNDKGGGLIIPIRSVGQEKSQEIFSFLSEKIKQKG